MKTTPPANDDLKARAAEFERRRSELMARMHALHARGVTDQDPEGIQFLADFQALNDDMSACVAQNNREIVDLNRQLGRRYLKSVKSDDC